MFVPRRGVLRAKSGVLSQTPLPLLLTEERSATLELQLRQLASAVEHFQYAVDIEPTGQSLAYLALAQFRMAPDFAAERSLAALAEACARDPECEEAWVFRADLAMSLCRKSEAEEAWRQAARLRPKGSG